MKKLLTVFINHAEGRGIEFSESDLKNIVRLSRENNLDFYKKFSDLYRQFYKNIVIPPGTSSFHVHGATNSLTVTFFNYKGEKIKSLIFKNFKREELEKILFKQLVGGE